MRTVLVDWKEFREASSPAPWCYVVDVRDLPSAAAKSIMTRGTLIKVFGITFIVMAGLPNSTFAAAAGTGIDAGADKVYKKLLLIAKWVIIFKGGIDTIKSVAEGDLAAAKKNFLGYGVTYAILWGLPWMMKEIDKLCMEMES